MPYDTKKVKGKIRIVDKSTGKIAKNAAGTAVDGGGHENMAKANKQKAALNISYARERGADIPMKRQQKRASKGAKYE